MNNKVLWVVGLLVVAAVVVFLIMNNKQSATTNESTTADTVTQSNQPTPPPPASEKKSLRDLMAAGSQKCVFTDGQNSGTVFTANGKTRMEFSSVANGVTVNSQALIDGQTYYSWVDGQPSGFKFNIDQSATGSAGPNQNVDINQQYNYDCTSWTVDASKFTLPTSVQFTDYSSFKMPAGN